MIENVKILLTVEPLLKVNSLISQYEVSTNVKNRNYNNKSMRRSLVSNKEKGYCNQIWYNIGMIKIAFQILRAARKKNCACRARGA